MGSGNYRKLNFILKYMGTETLKNIENYIQEVQKREYRSFQSEEEIRNFFRDNLVEFYLNSTPEEKQALKRYTGIKFRDINAYLRGCWNYEINGLFTKEKEKECLELAENMQKTIFKLSALPDNIKVYRGIPLSVLKEYGVSSLEDLMSLKGQMFFDSGFTSTSFIQENSFFEKEIEWHEKCNVEIEYFIPEECSDGFPLLYNGLSYCPSQTEYLLNKGNLSKITDVFLDRNNGVAHLKMVFIPEKVWNYSFIEERTQSNSISK